MVEEIEVLNRTEIIDSPSWIFPVLIGLCVIIFIALLCALSLSCDYFILSSISIIIAVIAFSGVIALCIVNPKIHTGRYSYECVIEDSVSLNEISDTYDIVEKRGKIWVLEDKEAVND